MNQQLRSEEIRKCNEHQLIALAKVGHGGAFEQLLRGARDQCFHIALHLLGDREDASDVVQTAFLKAYTHLCGFAEEAKFSTWVTKIVVNHCMMRLRSRSRTKLIRSDAGQELMDAEASRGRWTSSPEYQLASEEIRGLVRSELRALPRILRTAVELKHLQGYPLEGVAAELGITVGAAKSRLYRGQKCLRARLLRHCGVRGLATLTA